MKFYPPFFRPQHPLKQSYIFARNDRRVVGVYIRHDKQKSDRLELHALNRSQKGHYTSQARRLVIDDRKSTSADFTSPHPRLASAGAHATVHAHAQSESPRTSAASACHSDLVSSGCQTMMVWGYEIHLVPWDCSSVVALGPPTAQAAALAWTVEGCCSIESLTLDRVPMGSSEGLHPFVRCATTHRSRCH